MRSRGTPSRSSVLQATSRASVESRPPETPMATRRLADVFQPLGQAGDLGVEDFLAALGKSLLAGRHERMGVERTQQVGVGAGFWTADRERQRESRLASDGSRVVAEAVGLLPVVAQAVEVDVGAQQTFVALEARRLGQQRAVLGDQAVAAEDDVGGRFLRRRTRRRRRRPCSGRTG